MMVMMMIMIMVMMMMIMMMMMTLNTNNESNPMFMMMMMMTMTIPVIMAYLMQTTCILDSAEIYSLCMVSSLKWWGRQSMESRRWMDALLSSVFGTKELHKNRRNEIIIQTNLGYPTPAHIRISEFCSNTASSIGFIPVIRHLLLAIVFKNKLSLCIWFISNGNRMK